MAAWEITCQKYGASALGLQRVLGLGSYKTAWAWLHKFRRAMVLPGRDPLCGIVEVDETYVGAEEADVVGRRTLTKAMVVVAVEVNDGRIGRVRLRSVPDLKGKTLTGFVADVVAPGTTVRTDGLRAYGGLAKKGFVHDVTVIGQSSSPAHVEMPAVHRVVPLVKRWLLGTLQGGVSREHLPYYLDEYTFRFNRRTSQARGLLFYRLLEQAVQTAPTPTSKLYLGTGRGPRRRPRNPNR
jgi:transposase-like protein